MSSETPPTSAGSPSNHCRADRRRSRSDGHRDDTTGYRGYRRNRRSHVVRLPEETFLKADPSRSLVAHSRGFEWGYNGSGPAQLALALLYDHFGEPAIALDCYQQFTMRVVSDLEGEWTLTTGDIENAVAAIRGTDHGRPL
jgi:hypothetical protein